MGISVPILVYTHCDVSDVWTMFFSQLKTNVGDTKIYVAVNEEKKELNEYNQIVYDDGYDYTFRLKHVLSKISEDVFLFLHEDMILYDKINFEFIEKCVSYVKLNLVDGIKLILAGDEFYEWENDKNIVYNEYSKFSVQPTIIRKQALLSIIENVGSMDIWNFENSMTYNSRHFMVRNGSEIKRGIYHYDNNIFPFMSSAITKGRWNYGEYEKELVPLLSKYNINPLDRGII